MSTALRAPYAAASSPDRADIGPSPLAVWAIVALAAGPGLGLLGWLIGTTSTMGAIVVLVSILPWLVMMFALGFLGLLILITGGGGGYRRTKDALRQGRIGLTYHLRDPLGWGVIVVDEPGRRVCVNGHVFGFDDVR